MRNQLKFLTILFIISAALSFSACDSPASGGSGGGGTDGDSTISIDAIPGITTPVTGNTPVTTITETAQYTGTITWSDSPGNFVVTTVYTATITLTPKTGFTLSGVSENFFNVAGATTVTNSANLGIITAVFPATGAAPVPVSFSGLEQVGGTTETANSTSLTLTFDVDPTTLTADHITLTGATKGALSGSGLTRSLAISDISVANGETVSVAISNPNGFSISDSPRTAVVYKDTRVAVALQSAVQIGGTTGTSDTTGLILTFDVYPTTLTVDNITVTGATKGAITGAGTNTRSLAISDITVADGETVSVAISNPAGYLISGSPKIAVVYKNPFSGISYRDLVSITGGTYTQTDGTNSFSHTISNFSLGKYEVTYELWYAVYQWAIANGYTFANAGIEGRDGTAGAAPTEAKYEPVTTVNWRDTIVWLNAYSEMSGLTPCYSYSSTTIKNSRDTNATACDGAVCDWTANGYRLPTEGEWQYAASNKGATPYNYASGATADYLDVTATGLVAWYTGNSGSSTKPVGTTTNSSALTLWDMSGNVYEWCWDWYGVYPGDSTDYRGAGSGSDRTDRGGSWGNGAYFMNVGYRSNSMPTGQYVARGFRIARTN